MESPPESTSPRVVARRSLLPLILLVPLAIAGTALMVVAGRQQLMVTLILGSGACLAMWRYIALTLFGRTVAGPAGIRNRMIHREQRLAWEEIDSFDIRPSLFGRTLNVRRKKEGAVELSAPREGPFSRRSRFEKTLAALQRAAPADLPVHSQNTEKLSRKTQLGCSGGLMGVFLVLGVGVVIGLDQPWNSPIWPGRHEASSVPPACDALGLPSVTGLVPSGLPTSSGDTTDPTQSECAVEGSSEQATRLDVRYDLSKREPLWAGSGSHFARRSFHDSLETYPRAAWRSVEGLGDEARSASLDHTGDHNWIEIVVRRANVVLTVDYWVPGPREQAAAGAEKVAHAAVDRIRLG